MTTYRVRSVAVIATFGLAAASLQGCLTTQDGGLSKTAMGAAAGGGVGAIVGGAIGGWQGALIGGVAGVIAGGAIGRALDAHDQAKRAEAIERARAAPVGDTVEWSSPEKGTSGTVVRKNDVSIVNGRECMTIQETITIGGKPATADSLRCRDANGRWVQA